MTDDEVDRRRIVHHTKCRWFGHAIHAAARLSSRSPSRSFEPQNNGAGRGAPEAAERGCRWWHNQPGSRPLLLELTLLSTNVVSSTSKARGRAAAKQPSNKAPAMVAGQPS